MRLSRPLSPGRSAKHLERCGLGRSAPRQGDANALIPHAGRRFIENLVPIVRVATLHDDQTFLEFTTRDSVARGSLLVSPDRRHSLQVLGLHRVQATSTDFSTGFKPVDAMTSANVRVASACMPGSTC